MTEKEKKPLEFERYLYGGLASRLYSNEDDRFYTGGALEKLAGSDGLNLGEEALGFVRGTNASEEGIKTALNVYKPKYEEGMKKTSISDLVSYYRPFLSELDSAEQKKILSIFDDYKDFTYGKLIDEIEDAEHDLKGSDRKVSPEQKEKARQTIEKYKRPYNVLKLLENTKFESIRYGAVQATTTQQLKGLASDITLKDKTKSK